MWIDLTKDDQKSALKSTNFMASYSLRQILARCGSDERAERTSLTELPLRSE
jgi:hypothetical protein